MLELGFTSLEIKSREMEMVFGVCEICDWWLMAATAGGLLWGAGRGKTRKLGVFTWLKMIPSYIKLLG